MAVVGRHKNLVFGLSAAMLVANYWLVVVRPRCCAPGVAVRRLEGVESVDVSLDRGLAIVQLRPANRVTLEQLRRVVKNNGFGSREAVVTVVGELKKDGAGPALSVTGTATASVFTLIADPARPGAYQAVHERLRAAPGSLMTLVGIVEATPGKDGRDRLIVQQNQRALRWWYQSTARF